MKTNQKTFHSCLSGLLCCLSLWIGQAQAQSPSGDGFYLSFPLANRTAQTASINSVFDHATDAGVVIAYTGERGAIEYGSSDDGQNLMQSGGADFIINGHYTGVGVLNQLCYDNHHGIDFKTTDQAANGEIDVFAAADGDLIWYTNGDLAQYNTIEIDHGNGYKTRYLHLSSRTAGLDGTHVNRGQLIGVSGDTGATGSPHLHFALLRNDTLVDPYGWAGVGADPYTAEVSVNLWNPPSQSAATIRQGVDYSFSRPSPSGLKAAGYDFAIRYVGGSASKQITASEAQALHAAGLDIIIVFEGPANRILDGYAAGVSDANTAVTQAAAAGAPQNFFCYFTCDFDSQLSDQTAINAYLDGAASVLGDVNRVGFYGGSGAITRVLDSGKATKAWQTSNFPGIKDSRIKLYQYAYHVTLPDDTFNEFDKDEEYGDDLGQWSAPASTAIVALPSLGWTRQGSNLVLSWPTNDSAFMLYYTTNLFAGNWILNQVSPSVVDGQYTVTNAITGDNKFYRLQK